MIYTLVKSLFRRNMPRVPKVKTKSIIQSLTSILFISGLVYFIYLVLLQIINTFVRLRFHNVYFSFIFFIILLILIIVEVFLIVKNLYFSKDNELYLKLPIKKNDLFIAKLIYIYLSLVILTFVFLTFTAGLYGLIWQAVDSLFFIKLLILIFIFPLITTPIAILLSIPIAYFTKHITRNWWTLLLTILALVTSIFIIYMGFISVITNFINLTTQGGTNYIPPQVIEQINKITSMLPLGPQFYSFVIGETNILVMSFIIGSTIFLNIVSYFVLKKYFYQLLMLNHNLNGNNHNKPIEEISNKVRKPLHAIFIKEVKVLLKNPSYAFQAIVFNVLMPVFVFLTINLTNRVGAIAVGNEIVPGIALLTILIMLMISNSYQTTLISREKEAYYLAKIAPVSYLKQITTRLLVGLTISLVFLTLTILLLISFGLLTFINGLIIYLISILFLIGFTAVSVIADIKKPQVNSYTSETSESMKVFNVFFWGIFITVILSFIMIIMAYLPNNFMLTDFRPLFNLSERYSFYRFLRYISLDSVLIITMILTIGLYNLINIIRFVKGVKRT